MAGINSNASNGVIKKYIDAQDDKLQTNIDSEASARASADTTLQSNINKETSARLDGDNSLRTDLTAETNERKSADDALQANIDTEASTRAEQVGSLRTDLTAETNARVTADSALRTDIDTVTTGLSTETNERKTADSALQGNIDAETTARTTKDGELESSISSEVTRAKNAENTLTTNLNAEVTRAKNAEQANATAISNEASARETNDNALSARIDVNTEDIAALKGRSIRYAVYLDSASPTQAQLTSAYQSASGSTAPPEDGTTLVDLNYNKEYTWFESSSTWVDRGSSTITPATNSSYGSVKGQTADGTVKANDGLLSVNGWSTVKNDISANAESISDETNRAVSAENTLQSNIDAETSARTSEDGKLNTAISNETSRATGAENTLRNNIDAETSARTSADTTLQANIDKKITANAAITGGTFTKVTVDTKGLVTSGASLSASDIPVIAQSQVSGLTSALNGKQAVSNLVTAWQTSPDNTHYPSEKLVSDSITSEATARSESDATLQANINKKVTANANITAGTNCKITYDAKGLVTAGTSLGVSDIPTIPESKVSNLVSDLAEKQAKLTTGDYISIGTGNIISHGSSGVVAGTYGNVGYAPKITVDGFGHITSAENVSITADVANSLSTAGTVRVNLASSSAPTYTSGGNITPGVTGVLPVAHGGTGNSSVDTVPTANSTKMVTSGGVASALAGKQDELTPGANITISGTTISAKDTTYDVATASADGLMSSTDKSKLDGIEAGSLATSTSPQPQSVSASVGSETTKYARGDHRHPAYLSEHTVTINSTTLHQMIGISASDYVANGRSAHMKIECICTSTVNTAVRHTFTAEIIWSGANAECWVFNNVPSVNANSGVRYFRCLAPKSDSYGCSVDVNGYDAKARIIDLRILESDCPYTVTTAPSTNLWNSSYYTQTQFNIGERNYFFASNEYSGACVGRSGGAWDSIYNDRFEFGETTVVGALCALADDGKAYRLTNKTVKFKLPMIMGRCTGAFTIVQKYGNMTSNERGRSLSELSFQGFTVPTSYAIGDNLYLQGTLDGIYFKSDGVITTGMTTAGKTYIMFGKVEYTGTTTASYYTFSSYGVKAYTTNTTDATAVDYVDGRKIVLADNAGSSTRPVYFDKGIPVQCDATLAVNVNGNAASATKLQTARTIQTNLASTVAASFNGTANASPGVTGVLPVAHGGTGQSNLSNVTVGRATADASGKVISSTYMPKTGGIFTGNLAFEKTVQIKSTNIPSNSTPDSNYVGTGLQFVPNDAVLGSNTKYIGRIVPYHYKTYSKMSIEVDRIDGGTSHAAAMGLIINSSGTACAFAPTPPSNATTTEIATAAWVNSKLQSVHGISVIEGTFGDYSTLRGYKLTNAQTGDLLILDIGHYLADGSEVALEDTDQVIFYCKGTSYYTVKNKDVITLYYSDSTYYFKVINTSVDDVTLENLTILRP